MYTATMLYHFKPESFAQACEIWKNEILEHAKTQKGFVRMQLLAASPRAMAIGTWEDNLHARAFMETGVFKRLMEKLQTMAAEPPQQSIWDLKYFESKETRG
jgi:quinol monooxygenase YgiN